MSTTKITLANVRIALSYNFSTFEIASQLENENGISAEDIKSARESCQLLAAEALNEWKLNPNANPKVELQRIENKLAAIKKMVKDGKTEIVDPQEIDKIQNLPAYISKK